MGRSVSGVPPPGSCCMIPTRPPSPHPRPTFRGEASSVSISLSCASVWSEPSFAITYCTSTTLHSQQQSHPASECEGEEALSRCCGSNNHHQAGGNDHHQQQVLQAGCRARLQTQHTYAEQAQPPVLLQPALPVHPTPRHPAPPRPPPAWLGVAHAAPLAQRLPRWRALVVG